MTLEAALAEAARSGRLTGLTMWPTERGWQANAKTVHGHRYAVAFDPDPARAVLAALASLGASTAPPPVESIFE